MHAGGGDLLGGGAAGGLNLLGIPADRHAELLGEDGGARPERVAVDAVVANQHGDVQTGFGIHGLHHTGQVLGAGMQDRADMLVHDEVVEVGAAGVELHHLADLLLQGHAAEQVRDALRNGQVGVLVGHGGFIGHGYRLSPSNV